MRYDIPPWIIPTEFKVINPGQTEPFYIDAEKWTLRRYHDITTNARELQLTCKPEVPIQQFAEVLALDGAEYAFRGIVERYKKTKKENTFYVRGIENLLWHRFGHKWNYCVWRDEYNNIIGFHLGEIIKDHYSPTYPISLGNTDNCPGLLHIANSLMPWCSASTYYDEPKKIIKYSDWGTKSRMGATPALYHIDDGGVYPLTQRGVLSDLQTNDKSFFIDANDLYIRYTTCLEAGNCSAENYWYLAGRILANNVFDTKLRIGDIDYDDFEIGGYLRTAHSDTIADQLFGILKSFGLYTYLEDKADATYINAWTTAGQWIPPEGFMHTIDEQDKETIAFEKSIPSKPRVHSLRGYGVAEQIYSKVDPTWKGLWYEDLFEVENGYRDANGILWPQVDAEYANRQNDYQCLIKTVRKIFARPGDLVRVISLYDEQEDLPINAITNSSDGITILELNYKTPKFADAWQASGQLSIPYSNYIYEVYWIPVSATCQFNMRTARFPSCAFGTCTLFCGSFAPVGKERATLDVSFNAEGDPPIRTVAPMRMFVMISVNGAFTEDSIIYNWAYGDSISEIDITRIVTQNSNNTIGVQIYYMGELYPAAASCAENSLFTATISLTVWQRKELWDPWGT